MKKLFLIALAISAAAWLGCGETMSDQMGTNAPGGTLIDLDAGVYAVGFSNLTEYKDAIGQTWMVLNDRLVPDYTGLGTTDYPYTFTAMNVNSAVVFYGVDGPNYGLKFVNATNVNLPVKYTVVGNLNEAGEKFAMLIAAKNDAGGDNAGIAVALVQTGATTARVVVDLNPITTGANQIAAYADIADFTARDYAVTVVIGNDATATTGPSLSVLVDGTAVISWNGPNGVLALGTDTGLVEKFNTDLGGGNLLWNNVIWPSIIKGKLPLFGGSGGADDSTAKIGFALNIGSVGADAKNAPSIRGAQIDLRP